MCRLIFIFIEQQRGEINHSAVDLHNTFTKRLSVFILSRPDCFFVFLHIKECRIEIQRRQSADYFYHRFISPLKAQVGFYQFIPNDALLSGLENIIFFNLFRSSSGCQLSRACVPWVKTSLSFSTTRRRCQLLASLTQQPYCQFSDRAILTITTIEQNNKTKQTTSIFKTKGTTRRRCQLLTSLTQLVKPLPLWTIATIITTNKAWTTTTKH